MSATPRTRTPRRRRAAALLVAAAAITAAAVALSTASAQSPATRTLSLREVDKGATFKHVRNTRATARLSIAQGDLIVFTNPITDASGARVGKLHAQCVTTVGARDFRKSVLTCAGILRLRDGDLMVQSIDPPGATSTTGAVTGGTGAYANAHGVFTSTHTDAGSDDTITLGG
jgi:hypothetical protein